MKISGFILLIDPYLLRLGFTSLLNRIQGLRVLKEFGADDPFQVYLENHPFDYVLISDSIFESSLDFLISKPSILEKTILVYGAEYKRLGAILDQHELRASIHIGEDKEAIIEKIKNLVDLRDGDSSANVSTSLSPRETTIVRLVSMGLTNRQIAEHLFLSAHTVMTHRKNINSKLGIKSVSGLTVYAIVNNIITIEEVSSLPPK